MAEQDDLMNWFNQYSDDIYNFLVYYTGSKDVEDLVQEVFLKVMKKFGQFEGRSHPKTWLITIARRTAVDQRRKQRLSKFFPDSFFKEITAPDPSPEQALLGKEQQQKLYRLLRELKQAYQDVLILRGLLEMSVEETKETLGWSRDKVNITFYRAKQALRRKMEQEGEETDLETFS